jgi:alcohol dehydrogenase class IV
VGELIPGHDVRFEFATAARVVFGAGAAGQLAGVVAGHGSRALVCTGSDPRRQADLVDGLGLPTAVFPVPGEPTVEEVRTATAVAREHGADVVVAVGGGSVIDLAKAVAALLGSGGDPLDYLEVVGRGQALTGVVPCVAVPTTAGTGAEVTANSVITSPEHRVKVSLRSRDMVPRAALVDPVLTLGCPPAVTASSGVDALTQCLEPLVSVMANPITDGTAREGLTRAARGLRRAHADGSDLDARTDMAVCSLLGGISLANAKLGAVHALAGVVGGLAEVPHGLVCARLLVPVTEANVRALRRRQPGSPALERYAEAARLLTGRSDAVVEDGLDWLRETVELLGVPPLGSFGVTREHVTHVVDGAARASSMRGNPIVLERDELVGVMDAVLD